MADGQTTAIVAYEVMAEDEDRFLEAWQLAQDYLGEQSGFIDTALHKATSAAADFRFVNVARWSSPLAFSRALQRPEVQQAAAAMAFRSHPALYQVVR